MVCPFFLVWITNQLARRLAHQLGNRMKSSSRTMEQTHRSHQEAGKARSTASGLASHVLVAVVAILISLGGTPVVSGNVPSISEGLRPDQSPADQRPAEGLMDGPADHAAHQPADHPGHHHAADLPTRATAGTATLQDSRVETHQG